MLLEPYGEVGGAGQPCSPPERLVGTRHEEEEEEGERVCAKRTRTTLGGKKWFANFQGMDGDILDLREIFSQETVPPYIPEPNTKIRWDIPPSFMFCSKTKHYVRICAS
jgi:hypothetical protein